MRRLTAYSCTNEDATELLAALKGLPRLRTLGLTVHSAWPGMLSDALEGVSILNWDHWVHLPPMAQLAHRLTSLTLAGAVSLPPDWRHLTQLRELRIFANDAASAEHTGLRRAAWGSGTLSALTALTCLNMNALYGAGIPGAAEVASAPALAEVVVPGGDASVWGRALRAMRPNVLVREELR
ncbi:hypothetical protein COHA_002540 [Chlorella ohadii]|uniref:Leucine-rich repeat domain-containing protein n=1 Tax=Chlorella ohadii TaxID=2649997 RepID=A0AAD5DX49_9CHLO|nr:hypothetical protein COHA_002540 [Chlorella ohadii]